VGIDYDAGILKVATDTNSAASAAESAAKSTAQSAT
jgi:hypothetical protein